ncbi:MAG: CDP-glycerol:glycerophosphate glycerophosphotransferase [Lachnospiraceae bacterium]|nr:CDP-glycerol:glycerophosphate glycerophosphotransferase [Lachnospiraceae bacterium]
MARVSIIVPFKNYKHFLADCLASLDAQSFRDFEVVLVLDGNKEDVSDLTEEYGKRMQINTVKLEGKTGVAAARNLGIENAKGEYVFFLDSDDYIYLETIGDLIEAVDLEGADVVYCKKAKSYFKRDIFLPVFKEQLEQLEAERIALLGEDADDAEDMGESFEDEEAEAAFETAEIGIRQRNAAKYLVGKKKIFGTISVLGILIRRDILEREHIRFDESVLIYSDLLFVMKLLDLDLNFRRRYSTYYIKRTHNDPVNFPALSQEKGEDAFDEMVDVVKKAYTNSRPDGFAREALEKVMINYYSLTYAPRLRRSTNDAWRKERLVKIREVIGLVDNSAYKGMAGYKKRLCKALLSGSAKKATMAVNKHLAIKKVKRIFTKKHEIAKYFYKNRFLSKPLRDNVVMFESFFGKSYSDSPKYIYEYLAKNFSDRFEFVWVLEKRHKLPYGGKQVKRFSVAYMKYLATAKYFVFNVKQPNWFMKREGMVFLETWHGTPLKKLCFDVEEVFSASPMYKKNTFIKSREWDYLIAANEFSSKTFRRCYKYNNKMLEYGYPRNDILHAPDRDEKEAFFRKKLGIPEGKKTILYAPTWRDDEYYENGKYKFTLKLDLDLMRKELGDEYVVLLRTHYYIADSLDLTPYKGFAFNFCKYDDISELYLISDIIITDYSSVFFDYANLKRPMLFYTYDLEKYRDVLRGFYIDIEEELPGPLLYTTEEVVDAVKHIEDVKTKYADKYAVFYEKYCGWEDGHASDNVVKEVFFAGGEKN